MARGGERGAVRRALAGSSSITVNAPFNNPDNTTQINKIKVASRFPAIEYEEMIVDNACMQVGGVGGVGGWGNVVVEG